MLVVVFSSWWSVFTVWFSLKGRRGERTGEVVFFMGSCFFLKFNFFFVLGGFFRLAILGLFLGVGGRVVVGCRVIVGLNCFCSLFFNFRNFCFEIF